MDIKNIDLLALQTQQMRADPTIQGLCAGLNEELRKLAPEIQKCLGFLLLATAPELVSDEALDMMAYDLRVDWYDDSKTRTVRETTVLNSKQVYQLMGTPAAVEQAVAPYFNTAFVREWFEYDGDPLHYKIYVQGALSEDESALLFRAIRKTARLGAVLDAVATILLSTANLYVGAVMVRRQKMTISEG